MRLLFLPIALLCMHYGYDSDRLRDQERQAALDKLKHSYKNHVHEQQVQDAASKALNNYVTFISHSVEEAESIIGHVQHYYRASISWKGSKSPAIRLPQATGSLEEFYYNKTKEASPSLSTKNKQLLDAKAQLLWQVLEKLDEQYKTLEVYIRLKEYENDNLQKGDKLLGKMQAQLADFRKACSSLYGQVRVVYQESSIYQEKNPYQQVSKQLQAIMAEEQKLLDTWTYNLAEEVPTAWPLDAFQQSIAIQDPLLSGFTQAPKEIEYPASGMYTGFGSAIASMQNVKRDAIDNYTYQARQSDEHGNTVYKDLLNVYNNDMLAMYNQFVQYAGQQGQRLLLAPRYCPAFEIRAVAKQSPKAGITSQFHDIPTPAMQVKDQKIPISVATASVLNGYVIFINEAVRAMHALQVEVRNYQSTAQYYQTSPPQQHRNSLSYTFEDFKIPLSAYQQALQGSNSIPESSRAALTTQLNVLLNILQEMNALSVELLEYTSGKQYAADHFVRSNQILDRYSSLFETFDEKKEILYRDVRQVFNAYPPVNKADSWYVSGKALLRTLDLNRDALADVKKYIAGESQKPHSPDKLITSARELIEEEYSNLKGLKRLGLSNGLCPYTPYEDLAENSSRFAEKVNKLIQPANYSSTIDYEDFIYFYNNELVYEYNKFCELSQAPLLKSVLQPHYFIRKTITATQLASQKTQDTPLAPVQQIPSDTPHQVQAPQSTELHTRDTVYIEKTRVDTVYISTTDGEGSGQSMEGYAYNNMVLLLDVSASMNSPHKLPLLKKSVKRLLQMLRPQDDVAIVVYSGKAHVLLEPTPGNEISKISQAIDALKSEGGTDGNAGLKLAYKVADKNYKRGGNNRIILATDGEFPMSSQVYELVEKGAREDIYLSVFSYNSKESITNNLTRLSEKGKGHFEYITPENADLHLIREAKAKKAR